MSPSLRAQGNIMRNNVSATMCPRLPVPLNLTYTKYWSWITSMQICVRTFVLVSPCQNKIRDFGLKPWPNWVAGRRKLKTWVYLRLRLARPCVHLRWLAMSCAPFGRGQICTQVDASFSPFATQAKSTQDEWCPLTYYWPMKYRICPPGNFFFCDSRVLERKLACPFGHPTQVSTQV